MNMMLSELFSLPDEKLAQYVFNVESIPESLKLLDQWVCWRFEYRNGYWTKVPINPQTGGRSLPNESATWTTFSNAVEFANQSQGKLGIGFVPERRADGATLCCIDSDDPAKRYMPDSVEYSNVINSMFKIMKAMDTYVELSPSGNGLHIWFYADVPVKSRMNHSNCVEFYSHHHFLTVTGNVFACSEYDGHKEIKLVQEVAEQVYGAIRATSSDCEDIVMDEVTMTYDEFMGKLQTWANFEKVAKIANISDEQATANRMNQNSLDQAVANLIVHAQKVYKQLDFKFFTEVFRSTPRGMREKAKRDDYMKLTFESAIEDLVSKEVKMDFSEIMENIKIEIERRKMLPPVQDVNLIDNEPFKGTIPNPGGYVGMLAKFFYDSAFKQVPEIAMATALAYMAGRVGRAYQFETLGLNLYTVVLAGSSTGKSLIRTGPKLIDNAVRQYFLENVMKSSKLRPNIDPTKYRGPKAQSGVALHKALVKQPCFVCYYDEVASKFEELMSPRATPATKNEYDFYQNVFTEAKVGGSLDALAYSDDSNDKIEVYWPSFSFIGVTVPSRYKELEQKEQVLSGFLGRILTIEYESGIIEPDNRNANTKPSDELLRWVVELHQSCESLSTPHWQSGKIEPLKVGITDEANMILESFKENLRRKLNVNPGSEQTELLRAIWGRISEKATKVASIVAIGYNLFQPVITAQILTWAFDLVQRDAHRLEKKLASGEIGGHLETQQEIQVTRVIKKFIALPYDQAKKFFVTEEQHRAWVVPRRFFTMYCTQACFTKDIRGPSAAIDRTLKNLIESDRLVEFKLTSQAKGVPRGKAYQVVDASMIQ